MGKYNQIYSISIDSIGNDEIKDAIKDWAEGDESLEKLLWTCYLNGVKTSGCHAGARSYISFDCSDKLELITKMINVLQEINDSNIMVSMLGNPFSGDGWDLPNVTLGFKKLYKKETGLCFDKLVNALEEKFTDVNNHVLFKFMNFFLDKNFDLLFRLLHTVDDCYIFSIECGEMSFVRYNYFNHLFTKAGLLEYKEHDFPRYYWKIKSDNLNDILIKIDRVADYIINNYSFSLENNDDVIIDFCEEALYMKKNLSKKEFEKWLNKKREERDMDN